MNFADFTRDSMYMSIACYGEIASGMFVLFLPVVPPFFTHLKSASSFSILSIKRSKSGTLTSGASREEKTKSGKKSLFHISYTQGENEESEERLAINVVSTVSVKSETVGERVGDIEMGGRGERREHAAREIV